MEVGMLLNHPPSAPSRLATATTASAQTEAGPAGTLGGARRRRGHQAAQEPAEESRPTGRAPTPRKRQKTRQRAAVSPARRVCGAQRRALKLREPDRRAPGYPGHDPACYTGKARLR